MICGLLGKSLGHSLSPLVHSFLGDYDYRLFALPPEQVADFFARRAFDGLNVTIPYKSVAMGFCDEVSARAMRAGGVNTVVKRPDGSLYGDTTDVAGAVWALEHLGAPVAGAKVLVLGDGGAAGAVRSALADMGAGQVVTVSRRGPVGYGDLGDHRDAGLIINATPVGMYPNNGGELIDLAAFGDCRGVWDLIYNPLRTRLLLQADELGMACANGMGMLVAQARAAAELFCGRAVGADVAGITAAITARQQNWVLVGMPGCGKSTVARQLAKLTGREVVDTDVLVEQAAGKSIPEVFGEGGEPAFRALEREAVAEAGKLAGRIIAVGGGAVLSPQNRLALRQNGRVVWLRRPLEQLDTQGRPLSADGDGLARMWREREPLYRAFADVVVESAEGTKATAQRVLDMVK